MPTIVKWEMHGKISCKINYNNLFSTFVAQNEVGILKARKSHAIFRSQNISDITQTSFEEMKLPP